MANRYICAVVQGNLRRGSEEVLKCLLKHVDRVILSTWQDENLQSIAHLDIEIVQSEKPACTGFSHRNFQRLSTAAGVQRAAELGATHVLKWRTDMLPTKLDMEQLLAWSRYQVPEGCSSRVVTCAFRHLTVKQDWFSSMPDLFAFADLSMMQLLWGDADFDYNKSFNPPVDMVAEVGLAWAEQYDVAGVFCAESELYAIFKDRLQQRLKKILTHETIAKQYCYLFDHWQLGICWFGPDSFRSILVALQHPWWTAAQWQKGKKPVYAEIGYPERGLYSKWRRKYWSPRLMRRELALQQAWYGEYKRLEKNDNSC